VCLHIYIRFSSLTHDRTLPAAEAAIYQYIYIYMYTYRYIHIYQQLYISICIQLSLHRISSGASENTYTHTPQKTHTHTRLTSDILIYILRSAPEDIYKYVYKLIHISICKFIYI
jgi:hypothetical protein